MQKENGKQGGKSPPWRKLCIMAWMALLALTPDVPLAQSTPDRMNIPGGDAKEPVMLSADQLGYDRKNSLVVAQGHVEVVQGGTIVLADNITYNQNTNEVFAQGNVSLRRSDGNVLFANNVRLKDNLQAGVIQNFRARMADNSLFAAREARKYNAAVTELDYAVYSPCKLCKDKDPLWQVKAKNVRIDEQEQTVTYKNAMLEMWGVPVMWTPYLSHATPGADAKSGFLTPEWGANSDLGTSVKTPYFIAIAPNMDATVMPTFYTKETPVLGTEIRYLSESGFTQFRGSITDPRKRDENGNLIPGRELRGHVDAFGNFALDPNWNWGFQAKRASDDTYLRRYRISNDDLLTSRLFVEGIDGRSYTSLQSLAFQRLTEEANPDSSPIILPLGEYWWQGDPGWMGSRFDFNANTLLLTRREGPQSRRLSLAGGWSVPFLMEGGHVMEASVNLRGDAYSVTDVPQLGEPDFDGAVGRVIPEVALHWSYPLINEYAPGRSLLIEPVAGLILSPNDLSSNKIPNEDSQVLEFTDTNVFDNNRYPGYDLVESGPRVNYGVRGQWQFADTDYLSFLLGQNFRTSDDNTFPFSNDPESNISDYVGRVGLDLSDWLTASYRFRFDQEAFAPRRNEFSTSFFFSPVTLNLDYLDLNEDPFLGDRREIFSSGSLALTDNWTFLTGARRDLEERAMIDANAGFRYQDECFSLLASFSRSFITYRDVDPGSSVVLRVGFKNLE